MTLLLKNSKPKSITLNYYWIFKIVKFRSELITGF